MEEVQVFYHDAPTCTALFWALPLDPAGLCPACAERAPRERWIAVKLTVAYWESTRLGG